MTNILLLSLPTPYQNVLPYDKNLYEFKSRNRLWNTPNLGLLTVGAMLQEHFHVEYLDCNYEQLTHYKYEYVFMSPTTSQAKIAYQYANLFHRKGIKVVLGGAHVSALPQEAKQYADVIFIGESEGTINEFIQNPSKRNIYHSEVHPELTQTPIPLFSKAVKYPYSSIPVQLSRGCPHQCSFCLSSTIYGKKVRIKSLQQVKKELTYIKSLYRNPFVFFTDDNFFFHQSYALAVLEILKEMQICWYAFTDISIYKKVKILNQLYESGCRKLLIGFESLNEKNLYTINQSGFKASKLHEYKEAIKTVQKRKIGVVGSFVLGLEEDCEETFDTLYQFILDTCIYGTNITIATPFPGTKFFYEVFGEKETYPDWNQFDGFSLVRPLPNIKHDMFMFQYMKLIKKINSIERINKVFKFFREQL